MNAAYEKQAKQEALALIAQGYEPECLVHLIEYPKDYYLYGVEYMFLSKPLPAGTDLAGYTSVYYTLGELAQLGEE